MENDIETKVTEFKEEKRLREEPLSTGGKIICFIFASMPLLGAIVTWSMGRNGGRQRASAAWMWFLFGLVFWVALFVLGWYLDLFEIYI